MVSSPIFRYKCVIGSISLLATLTDSGFLSLCKGNWRRFTKEYAMKFPPAPAIFAHKLIGLFLWPAFVGTLFVNVSHSHGFGEGGVTAYSPTLWNIRACVSVFSGKFTHL